MTFVPSTLTKIVAISEFCSMFTLFNILAVEADLASMKTAIKEVLDSAVLAGNITSDQSKAITDELTGALVAKEKNKTTTATNLTSTAQEEAPNKRVIEELKTMKSKVAHVMEKCSDTINDCKRFKDAGICPFVATFMNGACAKTCNTCETKLPAKSRKYDVYK